MKIKLPSPPIIVIGSLGAFWIADIINPGFNPIGVMVFMLVPILVFEMMYPQPEIEEIIAQAHYRRHETAPETVTLADGELLTDKPDGANEPEESTAD